MADVTKRWIAPVLVTLLTCVLFPVCGMFLKIVDYTREPYVLTVNRWIIIRVVNAASNDVP